MTLSTDILGIISIISVLAAFGFTISHSVHMYVSDKKQKFYPVCVYITYGFVGVSIIGFTTLLIFNDAEGVRPMYVIIIAVVCYSAVAIRETHKATQRLVGDDEKANATP